VGRRLPGATQERLLFVLGTLLVESPVVFRAVVCPDERPRYKSPMRAKDPAKRAPLPVLSPTMRAMLAEERALPELAPPPPRVKQVKGWPDEYWYVRTVTQEQHEAGELPEVVDSSAVLNAMSEDREAEYLASLKAYETRTGRIKPD
jgi:hypothetical protein